MRAAASILLLGLALLAAACGGSSDGPDVIAQRFWNAAQNGDAKGAERYSLESKDTSFDFDNARSSIDDVGFGETRIESGVASVDTRIEGQNGDAPLDLSFDTVLVQRDGQWRVDLDETSNRMIQSMLGVTMDEFGEAMAEGMRGAMEGMAEGMADGMRQMGEAMGDAAAEAQARRTSDDGANR